MSAPAFTRVTTSRSDFGASAAPGYNNSHAQESAQSKKATVFPPQLREYVQRCFASENGLPDISAEQMQARLKAVIKQAADNDLLMSTDWDSLPLPQHMIAADRRQAVKSSVHQLATPQLSDMKPASGPPAQQQPPFLTNLAKSKKRKSSDMEGRTEAETALPPWRSNVTKLAFEDRITYPTPKEAAGAPESKKQKKKNGIANAVNNNNNNNNNNSNSKSEANDLEKRRQRFGMQPVGDVSPIRSAREQSPPGSQGPVIGTCTTLEKRYFRLTSAPKPETVRPLGVLKRALDFLIRKWKTEHNYSYICDQFKSLRQDLTVQHIKTDFTVLVYETHAHIALEQRDLGEYNQCQTQLRALYKHGLAGRPAEFLAYRILYFIYTGSRTDMSNLLANLSPADRTVAGVKHALDVRSALALGNYHRFFRLYLDAPDMGPYLMDTFIDRERLAALANICKAYKPDISLRFLTEELAFEDERECASFICDNGGAGLLESRVDGPVFNSGKGAAIFEAARAAAFRRIDIKGQI